MSSTKASRVKIAGHINEKHFAGLIGGEVYKSSPVAKKDVIDKQHRSHSVKAGAYWQIFLYSRNRLLTNTIFQGIGNVADIMVDCLDSYPENRADYLKNKITYKSQLQTNMRRLLEELQKPKILAAFLKKAIFEGDNTDYLSIYLGASNADIQSKIFHVFYKDNVINALVKCLSLRNSKARTKDQMDDQKIIFDSKLHGRSMGEIEDRHDSIAHYRQMKCRFKSSIVFDILNSQIAEQQENYPQVFAYGKARRLLK